MKQIKAKKGFTLVEVVITTTILFIILALVSPLLNYNLKSLYQTENKSDLQRDAYECVENFTKKAMEAKEIYIMKDTNDNLLVDNSTKKQFNITAAKNIKYINFVTGETGKNYIFEVDASSRTLSYKESDTDEPKIIAENIDYFQVQPLPIDPDNKNNSLGDFEHCQGIRIEVKFSMHLVDSYIISSEIKFRNNTQ